MELKSFYRTLALIVRRLLVTKDATVDGPDTLLRPIDGAASGHTHKVHNIITPNYANDAACEVMANRPEHTDAYSCTPKSGKKS